MPARRSVIRPTPARSVRAGVARRAPAILAGRRAPAILAGVLALVALCAPTALAATASVRVEVPTASNGLIPRTAVDLDGLQPVTRDGITCAANSAVAVLDKVTGGNWTLAPTTTDASNVAFGRVATGPDVGTDTKVGSAPTWVTYVAGHLDRHPCTDTVYNGQEVLLYPQCASPKGSLPCFADGPLFLYLEGRTFWAVGPENVNYGSPLKVFGYMAQLSTGNFPVPTTDTAAFTTDEGTPAVYTNSADHSGVAFLRLQTPGPHMIRFSQAGHVPDRLPICATDGADGFCGTERPPFNPYDPNKEPSTCATNGHDGFCGTTDTSGPVTHLTNLKNKQVFAKRRGPTGFKGTIDEDPNRVKTVRMRITRVTSTRVVVKPKKKPRRKKASSKHRATSRSASIAKAKKKKRRHKVRYRTIKRCTYWDDSTLLLEKARRCGTKYGRWFDALVDDPPLTFHYDFAMRLPSGRYTVEIESQDLNGSKDAPQPGRNVLTFTVK